MGFYFDQIRGPREYEVLDLFGEITPRIGSRGVEVSLKSITRSLEDWEQRGLRRVAMRAFHATSDMQPNEVVEIALPKLDESMGVFAGRSYAIRIRAKVR